MLYNKQYIPELNQFYHMNDDTNKNYVDYETEILNKSLSPYIFNSPIISSFLDKLRLLISLFFDEFNIIKNWRNFTVNKYWYKHVN